MAGGCGIYKAGFAALMGLTLIGASPPTKDAPSFRAATKTEAVRGQSKAVSEDQGCLRGREDRKSNTCAQWKAADAAADAAQAAWRQAFIGWIGLILGGITMTAAIAAAFYARSASIHADRALTSFKNAERAILRVVSASAGHLTLDQSATLAVTFKNIGRTASRITAFGSKTNGSAARWLDIAPGAEGTIAGPEVPEDINAVLDGWFWIEYRAIGTESAVTNFKICGMWDRDDGYSSGGWKFQVTNINGHPDDT